MAKSFTEERSLTEKPYHRVFHVVPEKDKKVFTFITFLGLTKMAQKLSPRLVNTNQGKLDLQLDGKICIPVYVHL